MRSLKLPLAATLAVLAMAAGAEAQDRRNPDRSERASGTAGGSRASVSDRPLPPEAVKRTWDFTKRFGIVKLGGRGGCGAEAEQAQARLNASNRLLADFLSGPSDPKKLGLERRNYLAQVTGAQRDIAAYLANFQSAGKRGPDALVPPAEQDICMARGQRISVLAVRDGLRGIAKVYPDMAEVGPVLAQADAALRSMGDDAAVAALVNRNRHASLAAVRLKPALSTNPEWIAGFKSAFARLVPGQTILKVHPYSANWYVHKNELTSYPEYRQIGAWVAARKADGTCWIHGIDLWQNYSGSGFDQGEYKLGEAPRQILCENV